MGTFEPEENSFSRIIHLQRGTGRLESLGETRTFERNKILIRQWEKPWYCYVVKSGKVVACDFTANGEERVYHVHEKDSVLLEESLLFGWESRVELKVIPSEVEVAGSRVGYLLSHVHERRWPQMKRAVCHVAWDRVIFFICIVWPYSVHFSVY